jgi:hypothetical protein
VLRPIVLLVLLASASDASGDDGDSFLGVGVGSGVAIRGELAERVGGRGFGMRGRMGFRIGHLGAELHLAASSAEVSGYSSASVAAIKPALTFHALVRGRFGLLARAGLGFGEIRATRTIQVPCALVEECTTRPELESVSFPGLWLDAGATAQVFLGSEQHVMLWIDLAGSLTRHQIEGELRTGYTRELAVGIARAFR